MGIVLGERIVRLFQVVWLIGWWWMELLCVQFMVLKLLYVIKNVLVCEVCIGVIDVGWFEKVVLVVVKGVMVDLDFVVDVYVCVIVQEEVDW